VQMLNITPDEVIGYTVLDTISQESGRVIGVVEDFHFESIHTSIKPTVIQGKPQQSLGVHVKIPSDKIPEKLAAIEKTWKEVMPGSAFKYRFMSDKLENMYASEIRIAGLIRVFSVLAVLIACLGLYGLASYTAEQKTKEIGVRKVLGATVPQILLMLIGKFMLMVLIACVIALPVGYFLMQSWLQNFVYQAEIGWTIFGISTLIIVVIALATVAYESIKASTINPTKAIRYE
ncbi:MAG: FtsX-like permease family protein, partial [Tunicatimonas sp.]|uniref:ABC transporter permease n=1 Tax=Tunicatimonas sp. TaxID=1940096 RepID=UPI003C755336